MTSIHPHPPQNRHPPKNPPQNNLSKPHLQEFRVSTPAHAPLVLEVPSVPHLALVTQYDTLGHPHRFQNVGLLGGEPRKTVGKRGGHFRLGFFASALRGGSNVVGKSGPRGNVTRYAPVGTYSRV